MWFPHQFKSKIQEVDFLAFGTDTANPSLASAFQIGVARFLEGQIVYEGSLLVNPEEWFDPYNINIHRIRDDYVVNAPNFISLSSLLNNLPRRRTYAIYTH